MHNSLLEEEVVKEEEGIILEAGGTGISKDKVLIFIAYYYEEFGIYE